MWSFSVSQLKFAILLSYLTSMFWWILANRFIFGSIIFPAYVVKQVTSIAWALIVGLYTLNEKKLLQLEKMPTSNFSSSANQNNLKSLFWTAYF